MLPMELIGAMCWPIGSGMCAKHNVKVIRMIKPKIMSVINKDGSLGWKSSEATILACPVGQKLREASTTSQSAHSDGKCVSNMNARIS